MALAPKEEAADAGNDHLRGRAMLWFRVLKLADMSMGLMRYYPPCHWLAQPM